MQLFLHYFLHFGAPFFIAYLFFKSDWKRVYLILLATMLVDLDHLIASPIFANDRCSINFHPLHTYWAMVVYVVLLFFKKPFRVIGIGLLFHMFTDTVDCMMTYASCKDCLAASPAIRLLETIGEFLGI
ncbi:DUF6122 family protein [Nonlabens antarcticus]|uniref:DUF6122 family protein n=1 Tax=Nonlabens antarcticus TaxID=392714 RepID=UPI001891D3C1|nr:DUF6122 family protein [Nonlabens antarcticus]